MWPLTFACHRHCPSRSLSFLSSDGLYVVVYLYEFAGSVEFEMRTMIWRKIDWRRNDVITYSNFMKFKCELTNESKQHTKSFWLDIKEWISIVGKLTENFEEKKWILSQLPSPLTNRVWASVVKKHLAKTATKSVHPFGWNFVHIHTHTYTHTRAHTLNQMQPPVPPHI